MPEVSAIGGVSPQKLKENYTQIGSLYVETELFDNFQKNSVGDCLTLKNGTSINYEDKAFNNTTNSEPTIISKGKGDQIVIENFNKQWATLKGTNGNDNYVIKNSSQLVVEPEAGDDAITIVGGSSISVNLRNHDKHDQVTMFGNVRQSEVSNYAGLTSRSEISGGDAPGFTQHFWSDKDK